MSEKSETHSPLTTHNSLAFPLSTLSTLSTSRSTGQLVNWSTDPLLNRQQHLINLIHIPHRRRSRSLTHLRLCNGGNHARGTRYRFTTITEHQWLCAAQVAGFGAHKSGSGQV